MKIQEILDKKGYTTQEIAFTRELLKMVDNSDEKGTVKILKILEKYTRDFEEV